MPFPRIPFRASLPLVFLLVLALFAGSVPSAYAEGVKIDPHPKLNAEGIHVQPWIKYPDVLDVPKAAREAAARNKSVMVIYEQAGCSYCRKMHTENFTNPILVNYLVEHFDIYQLDKNSSGTVIGPDGDKQTQSEFYSKLAITGTPTTLFFDTDGTESFRLPGYLETAFHYAALRYYVADINNGSLSINRFQEWINANAQQIINELEG